MGGMGSDFFLTSFVGTKLVFVPLRPLLIPLAMRSNSIEIGGGIRQRMQTPP